MKNKKLVTVTRTFVLLVQLMAIHCSSSIAQTGDKRARRKYSPMNSMHRAMRSNDNYDDASLTNPGNIHQHVQQLMEPNPSASLQITDVDKEKLAEIYGNTAVNDHEADFEKANSIGMQEGADEHVRQPIPWTGDEKAEDEQSSLVDEALLDAVNSGIFLGRLTTANASLNHEGKSSLDAETVKTLLRDLLERLDTLKQEDAHGEGDEVPSSNSGQEQQHCTIHGLWLSSVAGAAIELIPSEVEGGRIEILTRIYDLPERPEQALITSGWSGKGMISPESPTTLTIVFQEHLQPADHGGDDDKLNEEFKLPKTAVFVGQCLVCQRSPVLQGTWVVFPTAQSCMISSPGEKAPPPLSPDTFLQLAF